MKDKIIEILKALVDEVEFAEEFEFGYLGDYADRLITLLQPADGEEDILIRLFKDKKLGGFSIISDDIPEAIAEGETIKEALYNLQTAIEVMTEYTKERDSKQPPQQLSEEDQNTVQPADGEEVVYVEVNVHSEDDLPPEDWKGVGRIGNQSGMFGMGNRAFIQNHYNRNVPVMWLKPIPFTKLKSEEIWRDIPGYEECYQVSDQGNVKSLRRKIPHNKSGECWHKGMTLKPRIDQNGYRGVVLSKDGDKKTFNVATLMAMAFLNHRPNGMPDIVIDHVNNIQTDDRLGNLQLITNRENSSKDRKNKTSKYTGVSWYEPYGNWRAKIQIYGKTKNLGYFDDEDEAGVAYQDALKSLQPEITEEDVKEIHDNFQREYRHDEKFPSPKTIIEYSVDAIKEKLTPKTK